MSTHTDQIASVLHRTIQDVLSRGLNDPRVRGLVSVTSVKVSPDLAQATVLVSVLPREGARTALHGLQHAARHVRSQVAERVAMRRVPHLTFRLDPTLKAQADTLAAISRARRQDEQRSEAEPAERAEPAAAPQPPHDDTAPDQPDHPDHAPPPGADARNRSS